MASDATVNCPSCGSALPTGELKPGVLVQCARCNWQFRLSEAVPAPLESAPPPPPPPADEGTSGTAIMSFVLGLLPCLCVTGIPAIIFGAMALSEVNRRAGRLRGGGLAIAGIILGSVWSLTCAVLVGSGAMFINTAFKNFTISDDPAVVAQSARDIGVPEVPEGLQPVGGVDTGGIGFRIVIYADRKNEDKNTMIMVMQFPGWIPWQRDQMERQMREAFNQQEGPMEFAVEERRVVTYNVGGKEVTGNEVIGKDESGRRVRQYTVLMQSGGRPAMVIVHTTEPPEDPTAQPPVEGDVHLTDEQVRKFVEGFE